MPFVITTTESREAYERRRASDPDAYRNEGVSRRAVATLEEAQQEAALVIGARRIASDPDGDHEAAWPEWDDPALYALRTAESGRTVGPLPDGTVIEVEPVEYEGLIAGLGITYMAHFRHEHTDAEVIAAYNTKQGS